MINVFFVIHDFSGAGTYQNELSSYLTSDKNINLSILYLANKEYTEYTIVRKDNIANIFIPGREDSEIGFRYFRNIAFLLFSKYGNLKNVILHVNAPEHFLLAKEFKRLFKCKIIFTLHHLKPLYTYNDRFRNIHGDIPGTEQFKDILKLSDHIICVTEFAKRVITQIYNVDESKISIIYNGLKPHKKYNISKNKSEIKSMLGFYPQERIILFVGLIDHRKGLDIIIKAFGSIKHLYKDLRLVIIGDGNYGYYLELAQKYMGRINFAGKMSRNEILKFYYISDIGIIPSRADQCSYVALEMMQSQLPIIVSDIPGLSELFHDGENALIFKTTPKTNKENDNFLEPNKEDLVKKIKTLLDNKELANRLASNSYKKIAEKFSHQIMGNETKNVYKSLIRSSL